MHALNCPSCGHDNIAGDEHCAECGAALTPLSEPTPRSAVESSIMQDPLVSLGPAEAFSVSPDTPLRDVVAAMAAREVGSVLVVDNGRLVGIFSERDVLMRVGERYAELREEPIRAFMTADPETLPRDASVAFAINRMALGNYRHIPVVDGARLVGVLSVRDMLRYLSAWYADTPAS